MLMEDKIMQMTLRWFGTGHDSVTLEQIRQVPGVKGVITPLYDSVPGEAWKTEDIKRLKELANGVEITYELQEPLVLEEGEVKDVYKINISGLTDELIIFNDIDNESYTVNTNFNDYVFYWIYNC